jgi:hypothetical protein
MTHNIIKTDNYLFVVDDSDIRKGDWYLRYNQFHMKCTELKTSFNEALKKEEIIIKSEVCGDPYERSKDFIKKIIAHLPLNNSPVLEGIDLLPALEDGVEESEKAFTEVLDIETKQVYDKMFLDATEHGFIIGYNKAKEKYKFTEEDLREVLFEVLNTSKEECCATHTKDSIVRRVIKSLQQPKIPDAFECKMVTMNKGYTEESDYPYQQCDIPKITTNSQGLTQWVGSYIFKTKNQN